MALKKLSITLEQAEQVKSLLVEGLSHYKISNRLNIARSKVWRNVQVMGLGKSRQRQVDTEIFRWQDYDNRVI